MPIIFNLLAFLITAAVTTLLVWGIKESARFNSAMVLFKIVVLLFFVGLGFYYVSPATMKANWTPFQPNGWKGTLSGAAIVFFAYIGFDAVSTVAEETKKPGRDLPIGILASLTICTLFYVVIAAVFSGMIPYKEVVARPAERAESLTMALHYVAPERPSREHHRGVRLGRGADGRLAGFPARTATDLLLDGPRRPAASGFRQAPPSLPHPLCADDLDRPGRGRDLVDRQH